MIIFVVTVVITAEELVLASYAVSAVRIVSQRGGGKAPTTSVVMTFDKTKDVLLHVKYEYMSFKTNCISPVGLAPSAIPVRLSATHQYFVRRLQRPAPYVWGHTVMTPAQTEGATQML